MERNNFIFYKDWWAVIEQMPDQMALNVLKAIGAYGIYGVEPSDPEIRYSVYGLAKQQIDRDQTKYDTVCKKKEEYKARMKAEKEKLRNANDDKNRLSTNVKRNLSGDGA